VGGSGRRWPPCGRSVSGRILRTRSCTSHGDRAPSDLWFPPVKTALGAGQWGRRPVLVDEPDHHDMMDSLPPSGADLA
jgi:hypothetical protein